MERTTEDTPHRRIIDAATNVVSLASRRQGAADCFHEVETYWEALCDGRMMPDRDDLDPRGIAGALERTFLLDRLAPGVVRFRLAGRHLADLMGMDVRGMPLTAFFLPGARDQIADAVEAVFAEPARIDLRLETEPRLLRSPARARLLMLPLRDRDGEVTRAIGCLSAGRITAKRPVRFNIADDDRRTLIGYAARPAPFLPAIARPKAPVRAFHIVPADER